MYNIKYTITYENQYISRNLNCDWSVITFAVAIGADIPLLGFNSKRKMR